MCSTGPSWSSTTDSGGHWWCGNTSQLVYCIIEVMQYSSIPMWLLYAVFACNRRNAVYATNHWTTQTRRRWKERLMGTPMRLHLVLMMKWQQSKSGANNRFDELRDPTKRKRFSQTRSNPPHSASCLQLCMLRRTSTWPRSSWRTQTHTAPSTASSPNTLPIPRPPSATQLSRWINSPDAVAAALTLLPQTRGAVCRHVLGGSTGLFVCLFVSPWKHWHSAKGSRNGEMENTPSRFFFIAHLQRDLLQSTRKRAAFDFLN